MRKSAAAKNLFKARTLHFEHYEMGSRLKISLYLPDLSSNKVIQWSDWGPNYDVALSEFQSIRLIIQDSANGMVIERSLHPGHLLVESPMLEAERERSPLVCNISDSGSGLNFYLSFSKKGELIGSELKGKTATWFPCWQSAAQLSV